MLAEVVQQPRQAGMEAGAANPPHFDAPPYAGEALPTGTASYWSGDGCAIATLPVSALRLTDASLRKLGFAALAASDHDESGRLTLRLEVPPPIGTGARRQRSAGDCRRRSMPDE